MTLIEWLLEGDISIKYQLHRDLIESTQSDLSDMKNYIHQEGWAKKLLDLRDIGTNIWGGGIYSPKFISTHYTLLELKNLNIDSSIIEYQESATLLMNAMWLNKDHHQDICVTAMMLSILTYGKIKSIKINEMVDYILNHQFSDGGWNCRWQRAAVKSSLHTTLSVLESFRDYENSGYFYRIDEIKLAIPKAIDWMLSKKLFRSYRTNEIINTNFLNCPYPSRWKYDILRALEYLASIDFPYDERMEEALTILKSRMDDQGYMPVEKPHAGKVHFRMENPRFKSRWNTLRMLRVLKQYDKALFFKYWN